MADAAHPGDLREVSASPALPLVQALRGAAALAVVFQHVTDQAGALVGRPGTPPWPWLRPLAWDAGVDVFFAISGFVMVWSSWRWFGREGAARHFLIRRIARVAPLYWALTALLVAGGAVAPSLLNEGVRGWGGVPLVVASFLFWPWRRPDGSIQPVFRLGWTLQYEMFFYAVFAVAMTRRLRVGVPGVVAALVLLAVAGLAVHGGPAPVAAWTDPIVLEFCFGVALASAALAGFRLPPAVCWGLTVVSLVALGVFAGELQGWARVWGWGLPGTGLVAACALGRGVAAVPRWTVALGDASYALYLVHPFPMRLLERVWRHVPHAGSGIDVGAYIGAAVLLSVALALPLHHWVETGLTRGARRWLEARVPGAA